MRYVYGWICKSQGLLATSTRTDGFVCIVCALETHNTGLYISFNPNQQISSCMNLANSPQSDLCQMCVWEVKMAIDLLAWVSCPSARARWDSGACSRAASRASARAVSLSHADPVRCLGESRSSVLSSLFCPRCLTSPSLSFLSAKEWQRNRNRSRAAVSGHLARETSSRACRFLDYRLWRHGGGGLCDVWKHPKVCACIVVGGWKIRGCASERCPRFWNRMWHMERVGNSRRARALIGGSRRGVKTEGLHLFWNAWLLLNVRFEVYLR